MEDFYEFVGDQKQRNALIECIVAGANSDGAVVPVVILSV